MCIDQVSLPGIQVFLRVLMTDDRVIPLLERQRDLLLLLQEVLLLGIRQERLVVRSHRHLMVPLAEATVLAQAVLEVLVTTQEDRVEAQAVHHPVVQGLLALHLEVVEEGSIP